MGSNRANWSELHPDILTQITGFLKTRQDLHCFRSVCRNWRLISSLLSLQTLPLLHPLLPLTFSPTSLISPHSPFTLSSISIYLIRPKPLSHIPAGARAQSWVVTVEESTRGKLRIRLPLTSDLVECLPRDFPMCLNLYDYDVVSLVTSGCCVRALRLLSVDQYSVIKMSKVVWFENPGIVLVLFDQGSLGWVKVGCEMVMDECGYLHCGNVSRFDDIVEFGSGFVYAVDRNGRVFVIRGGDDLRVECVARGLVFSGCDGDRRKRLVVDAFGVLYLVYRDVYCGDHIHFKVYRFDKDGCRWEEVVRLGERRLLFVGVDCCFFASSDDFLGCRENCIIFHKDSFPRYDSNRVSSSDSFFEEDDEKLSIAVFHLGDCDAGLISSYPGLSAILWPPPLWLSSNSPSYAG